MNIPGHFIQTSNQRATVDGYTREHWTTDTGLGSIYLGHEESDLR